MNIENTNVKGRVQAAAHRRRLTIPRPCLWQLRTPKIGICGIKSGKSGWRRDFCEKSGYPDKIGISIRSVIPLSPSIIHIHSHSFSDSIYLHKWTYISIIHFNNASTCLLFTVCKLNQHGPDQIFCRSPGK